MSDWGDLASLGLINNEEEAVKPIHKKEKPAHEPARSYASTVVKLKTGPDLDKWYELQNKGTEQRLSTPSKVMEDPEVLQKDIVPEPTISRAPGPVKLKDGRDLESWPTKSYDKATSKPQPQQKERIGRYDESENAPRKKVSVNETPAGSHFSTSTTQSPPQDAEVYYANMKDKIIAQIEVFERKQKTGPYGESDLTGEQRVKNGRIKHAKNHVEGQPAPGQAKNYAPSLVKLKAGPGLYAWEADPKNKATSQLETTAIANEGIQANLKSTASVSQQTKPTPKNSAQPIIKENSLNNCNKCKVDNRGEPGHDQTLEYGYMASSKQTLADLAIEVRAFKARQAGNKSAQLSSTSTKSDKTPITGKENGSQAASPASNWDTYSHFSGKADDQVQYQSLQNNTTQGNAAQTTSAHVSPVQNSRDQVKTTRTYQEQNIAARVVPEHSLGGTVKPVGKEQVSEKVTDVSADLTTRFQHMLWSEKAKLYAITPPIHSGRSAFTTAPKPAEQPVVGSPPMHSPTLKPAPALASTLQPPLGREPLHVYVVELTTPKTKLSQIRGVYFTLAEARDKIIDYISKFGVPEVKTWVANGFTKVSACGKYGDAYATVLPKEVQGASGLDVNKVYLAIDLSNSQTLMVINAYVDPDAAFRGCQEYWRKLTLRQPIGDGHQWKDDKGMPHAEGTISAVKHHWYVEAHDIGGDDTW
ncbi:hypothetical protein B0O99DRAFT_684562 [Bisporella sp. PMI_857]|nr:hypothetical protein B0O99DRAFT_684562 [Bisporella sp. PMI_857]